MKNQLAPCIWDIDSISQKVSNYKQIHIESQVEIENDNEIFYKILETGIAATGSKDNYSKNYQIFKEKCDKYAESNPMQWKRLCVTILKKCIILPIECVSQETALTIFSTLNDRGLQLYDSDIFKAQLYRNCATEEKRKEFTQIWKELTQTCKKAEISLDDIFRYYTYVLRVRKVNMSKSAKTYITGREVALRRFYAENKYEKLKDNNLLNEIIALADFWSYIWESIMKPKINLDEEKYAISTDSRKYLHCLYYYPNEYWKFVVSVFFIKNRNTDTFDEKLKSILKNLIALLFCKYMQERGTNFIKDDIFNACISLYYKDEFPSNFTLNEERIKSSFDSSLSSSSNKISRAFLLLDAYLNPLQKTLIPDPFDIEHIFPRKWQNTNYNGWDEENARNYLDLFGNKVVCEKKLNIQAGNGYFGLKKIKYEKSCIENVKDLAHYRNNDWAKSDIEERDSLFRERILTFFKKQLIFLNLG